MTTIVKVFRQTFWQLLGKSITSLSTFIILAAVARYFGQSGTGQFTLALAYLAFFYIAADLGINAYLLPSFLDDRLEEAFRKLFGLRIVLALVLISLAAFLAIFMPAREGFLAAVMFGLPAILGFAVFTTSTAVFQARAKYSLAMLSQLAGSLITLLTILAVIWAGWGPASLTLSYSLGWLAAAAASLLLVTRLSKQLSPQLDFRFIKTTFLGAWPICLTLVLNTVYFRVDAFILSAYKALTEVGVYNLAFQVFQTALVLPAFIMNGYYPLMLKDLHSTPQKFFARLKTAALIMVGLGLVGALAGWLISPPLILVLTGGGFSGSVESLQVLSLSLPAFFTSAVLMWALVALKQYRTVLVIYAVALAVNIALNILFIPRYSYLAASWITAVTEYLILSALGLILSRHGKIHHLH